MEGDPKIRRPSDLPLTEIEREINALSHARDVLETQITLDEATFVTARQAYTALIERRQKTQAFIDTLSAPESEEMRTRALEALEHINSEIEETDELFKQTSVNNALNEEKDAQLTDTLLNLEHRRKRNAH